MTNYNPIPNTDIDTDSPITQQLLTWLRDNAIAITEGSPGAPKIQTAALQDLLITTAKIANDQITSFKLQDNSVLTGKINGLAVTEAKLAGGAVTTTKLADQAVTSAKLGNSQVKSNHLSVSSIDLLVNTTGNQNTVNYIAIPNSFYSLGVEIINAVGNVIGFARIEATAAGGGIGGNSLRVEADGQGGGGAKSATGRAWYVTASPPYYLNDVKAHAFIYLFQYKQKFIDAWALNGEVIESNISAISAAESPPWINYPGFSIQPDFYQDITDPETGEVIATKAFKNIPDTQAQPGTQAYLDWLQNPTYTEQEITPEYKNTHLADIPHPWTNTNLDNKLNQELPEAAKMLEGETWQDYAEVIFLDPLCNYSELLLNMLKTGGDVTGFINSGGLNIGGNLENSLLPGIQTKTFTFA